MSTSEVKHLKGLESENARLKRLLANHSNRIQRMAHQRPSGSRQRVSP